LQYGPFSTQHPKKASTPRREETLLDASIYEVPIDPDAANTSHALALSMIGYNKSVLEVGCSTGFFTKFLVERGCNVVGIELDADAATAAEKWADRVIVGDVDAEGIWSLLEDDAFDVIVLGDVLEHLRDPLTSLRSAARKLKPSGFVVASVPNIAHGDVRLALLQGEFRYSETGLLDRTHLHFFTLESARDLFEQAGLVVLETERVIMPLFESEIGVRRADVPYKVLDEVLADPEAESYQFVMKAVRDDGTRALAELATRVTELSDHVHYEVVRTALLRKEFKGSTIVRPETRQSERPRRGVHQPNVQEYVEALEDHVRGLEHNIELLEDELKASDLRFRAMLGMKTIQMTSPIRWLNRKIHREKPAS
jgi:2-polyprenyl-3-methyl-5-hydroxy-6-metoxy-1,4-benzoquinol methylase